VNAHLRSGAPAGVISGGAVLMDTRGAQPRLHDVDSDLSVAFLAQNCAGTLVGVISENAVLANTQSAQPGLQDVGSDRSVAFLAQYCAGLDHEVFRDGRSDPLTRSSVDARLRSGARARVILEDAVPMDTQSAQPGLQDVDCDLSVAFLAQQCRTRSR
jgi:hypothetical protein